MSFRKICRNFQSSRNLQCLYLGSFVSFFTFLSYWYEEKLFFLIPIILIPLYSVQFSYFLPMLRILAYSGVAKFEDVDISSLKGLFTNVLFFEISISLTLLICAFSNGKFVPAAIVYALYAIIAMIILTIIFKYKFHKEAVRQKIDIKIKNVGTLFAAIREHVKKEIQNK